MDENSGSMRIIIYGAGATGTIVGAALVRAGRDVILIGRPGHIQAIQEQGLQLVTSTGTFTVELPAVTTPDQIDFGSNDVVYLCVKTQDVDKALRELRSVVENVPVFCATNGVRSEEIASKHFSRIYGVRVGVGGTFLKDGEVIAEHHVDHLGWPIMGRYPTGVDYLVEAVAANLRTAGLLVLVTPDIMAYKWGQLISNLRNVVSAITNVRSGEGENKRISEAVQKEGLEILDQAGIHYVTHEEVLKQWPLGATIDFNPNYLGSGLGSTWQSLTKQRPTAEVDFLNGEIVQLAKQLGRKAPVNETLLGIVQKMLENHEKPGKYTPAELCRLIGLD